MIKNIPHGTFIPGPAGHGTLDMTGAPGGWVDSRLQGIANDTTGRSGVIVLSGFSGYGFTSSAGILTFEADTSFMHAGDILLIKYDDQTTPELPVNASKEAGGHLESIDSKIPVSPSTSGKQDTGNTSLASIDSKTTATPATSTLQTAGNTKLDQLIAAIQATVSISGSVWFDPTVNPPVFYIRVETDISGVKLVSWETPSGAAATPTVSNLVAVSNAQNIQSTTLTYNATAPGTGYTTGDILLHCFGIDTAASTPAVLYSIWMNAGPSVASGSILASAPGGGTFTLATQAVTVTGNVTLGASSAIIGKVGIDQTSDGNTNKVYVGNTITTNADTAISGTVAPSKGFLMLGKSSDIVPAYYAFPLVPGGLQLAVGGSAAVGSTVGSYPVSMSGKDGAGNKQHILVDVSGALNLSPLVANAAAAKLTDGVSTMAVKAGNTLPAASDPAAVFTLRDTASVTTVNGIIGSETNSVFTAAGQTFVINAPTDITRIQGARFVFSGTAGMTFGVTALLTNGATVTLGIINKANYSVSTTISTITAVFEVDLPANFSSITLTSSGTNQTVTAYHAFLNYTPSYSPSSVVATPASSSTPADGVSPASSGPVNAYMSMFNGATMDRVYNNIAVSVLAAGTISGVGTTTTSDVTNRNGKGIKYLINVTAISGSGATMTITAQDKDSAISSNYFTTPSSSLAITATGQYTITIYPGIVESTVSPNVRCSNILARLCRLSLALTGTTPSITMSIAATIAT